MGRARRKKLIWSFFKYLFDASKNILIGEDDLVNAFLEILLVAHELQYHNYSWKSINYLFSSPATPTRRVQNKKLFVFKEC